MEKRIVITGLGVVAPNGIGKDEYWSNLKSGVSGIRPITVFDSGLFRCHTAGEVPDFEAEKYLGDKGLRNLDRGTKLLLVASKLALEDANIQISDRNCDDIGIVTATTLSFILNVSEFRKEAETDGPQFVNPGLFPVTTMNAPSSQVSIRFGIKAFNTTVSTGFTASLDALRYAMDMIRFGRAKSVLVAGVEALFFQSFVGFYKMEFLAGIRALEISCPFDKRRNGVVLGEGASVIVIEDENYAQKRNARIYSEVAGVESFFDPYRSGKYSPEAKGLKKTMDTVIDKSGLEINDINYISASANSVQNQDQLETIAIKDIFGALAPNVPCSALKSMVGETVSAAGLLQVAASVGSITQSFIPPTINYEQPDDACGLDCVPNISRAQSVRNVLINNFGPGGNNASAIIRSYDE